MNDTAVAIGEESTLVRLLERHFSEPRLTELLGPRAAALDSRIWQRALRAAAEDFFRRPGKEFRAGLVRLSYRLAGGVGACPESLAQLVEILHAGSLIVDDIQDASPLRRGEPALHLRYGLPVALNAGNWMYFHALSLVQDVELRPELQLQVYRLLHLTLLRCHHGQGLDLTARVFELRQEQVAPVVQATSELKTGALMELSARLGAVAAGADSGVADALGAFGRSLGVTLQMLDDWGGLASERRCHEGHEDLLLARPTWPWAWLSTELDAARFAELSDCCARVSRRDLHPELLARRLRHQLSPSGSVRARRQAKTELARLEAWLSPGPALAELRAQMARMERSYE